jgi:hypothetical protein
VTAMLRAELASLEAALEHLRYGMTSQLLARLTQHEAYNYTGAGTSAGITSPGAPPAYDSCPGAPLPDPDDGGSSQTPMCGEVQRRTATLMRSSVGGGSSGGSSGGGSGAPLRSAVIAVPTPVEEEEPTPLPPCAPPPLGLFPNGATV